MTYLAIELDMNLTITISICSCALKSSYEPEFRSPSNGSITNSVVEEIKGSQLLEDLIPKSQKYDLCVHLDRILQTNYQNSAKLLHESR